MGPIWLFFPVRGALNESPWPANRCCPKRGRMFFDPLEPEVLIERIFPLSEMPDARLGFRLKVIAKGRIVRILEDGNIQMQVDRTERRGEQRFFANPRIDIDWLTRHVEAYSIQGLNVARTLVVAHDGCEVDLHGRWEPDDAGPLRSSKARGYIVFSSAVMDLDTGFKGGMLYARAWTRPYPEGKKPAGKLDVEREWRNEDQKWAWGLDRAHKLLSQGGIEAKVYHTSDAEGASFATLAHAHAEGYSYVTRAGVDRRIEEYGKRMSLRERLQKAPFCFPLTLQIGHRKGGQDRTARVEVRHARVLILPNKNRRGKKGLRKVEVDAVWVRELTCPAGHEPVDIVLLGVHMNVQDTGGVRLMLEVWQARWVVEEMNKMAKTGCGLESEVVSDIHAFRRLMLVVWPLASHLARWTHAARVYPTQLASKHASPETLQILREAARYHHLPLPQGPLRLKDLVGTLARLGGYEPRKGDKPGFIRIWRGFAALCRFASVMKFARQGNGGPKDARSKRYDRRVQEEIPGG